MIDLYTWATPNGRKITIMLEEVALEYSVHPINIGQGDQHQPAFLEISPNNKIPAIIDRDNGVRMFESGAILIYLAEKTGKLMPMQDTARWQTIEWLMWQMGGVGPMLGQVHHYTKFNPGIAPYAEERYLTEGRRIYRVLNDRLAEHEYLNGEGYSIADIATWPWIARYDWQTIDLGGYPNVKRWYLDIAGRPAVQRGWNIPESDQKIPLPD